MDEDRRLNNFAGEPQVPSGRRRSTYTPPPAEPLAAQSGTPVDNHDDDELASALAEEVSRYTAPTPAQTGEPPAYPQISEVLSPPAGPESSVSPESSAGPAPKAEVGPGGPDAQEEAVAAQAPEWHAVRAEPAPVPLASSDPALPATIPAPPERRSLSNEELASLINDEASGSADTGAVIGKIESQLQLRQKEAQEFRVWENAMLALGTPQALAQLEQVRPAFTGVIPIVAPSPAPADLEPEPVAGVEVEAPVALVPPPVAEPIPSGWRYPASGGESSAASREFDALLAAHLETDETLVAPEGVSEFDAEYELDADEPRVSQLPVELVGLEPTPLDQRVGRAARLFWLWFAANSSVLSVAVGATVFSLGMSLRQSIIAILIGVALSFLPLGLGTLASKRSGQPVMVISRATFGLAGNVLPAVLALITRVFWGAVLLWLVAVTTASILIGANLNLGLGSGQLTAITLAIGFVLASTAAFFGYRLIARIQLVLTIVSTILIIGFIALTAGSVKISVALSTGDGPWVLVVTGAVLVFSFVGLVWAQSSGDLARYQQPGSSGSDSMLWSTFGATLPAFVLVSYGALLAASNPDEAARLIADPVRAISSLLPGGYPLLLIGAISLSLLSGVVIALYSGGFALQAAGLRIGRIYSVIVVGVMLASVAVVLTVVVDDFAGVFRDLATSLAVPVAAWAGIFGAELMIRSGPFSSRSLLRRGGIYPDVNWINLVMLVVASVVGYGLTSASIGALSWQGYLFPLFGTSASGTFASTDIGVLVALALGLLTPIIAGVPAIRRQEAAESGPEFGPTS